MYSFYSGEFDGELRSIFIKGLPKKDREEVENLLWGLFEEFEPKSVNLISPKGVAYVQVNATRNHLLRIIKDSYQVQKMCAKP